MAFKMNGSPAKTGGISGTAGHSSALKMKAESALKAKNPKAKTYNEAFDDMDDFKMSSVKGHETRKDEYKDNLKNAKLYPTKSTDGEASEKGRTNFTKDAKAWNMKTYGTENPTSAANKAGMTKKEYAAKYKSSKTKADSKTTVAVEGDNKGKTVVKGLGAKKSKTLTPSQKATEKVKIVAANTKIKKGKTTKDKNLRDEGQLEKGEIKSGRDNAKTGTMLSRALAKRKVKRNARQLAKRAKKDSPADMNDKY